MSINLARDANQISRTIHSTFSKWQKKQTSQVIHRIPGQNLANKKRQSPFAWSERALPLETCTGRRTLTVLTRTRGWLQIPCCPCIIGVTLQAFKQNQPRPHHTAFLYLGARWSVRHFQNTGQPTHFSQLFNYSVTNSGCHVLFSTFVRLHSKHQCKDQIPHSLKHSHGKPSHFALGAGNAKTIH